ncbi:hypothetical protein CONLIGDRAFT_143140 [Coniochaeta ligniaria NRRL 30616]|uniref:Secreted protein n=1 Tax=Coniochaeta ligniaria NRRL 30616 TaxID=1408157 RepID=A0A1J7IZU3_9PEZI|nr:hypothetical protein CONLIGDRAFT_143140 [Coniochaeta ligniaria NRRL 30616]
MVCRITLLISIFIAWNWVVRMVAVTVPEYPRPLSSCFSASGCLRFMPSSLVSSVLDFHHLLRVSKAIAFQRMRLPG